MKYRILALGISTLLLGVASCASVDEISAEYQKTALAKYSELDVGHFTETMTVKDDDLETEAVFTTKLGSRPNASSDPYLSLISNKNDEFMRAIVSKSDGIITYQMYFSLESSDWRNPYQINFGEPVMPPFLVGIISRLVFKRHVSCAAQVFGRGLFRLSPC